MADRRLLNYTTGVNVDRTVAEITKMLAKHGAHEVRTTYTAGGVSGIAFVITTPHGPQPYQLPVRVDRVLQVINKQGLERRYRTREHAAKVAWRIVKDWLAAQLALLETEMVTLDQVMLPYAIVDAKGTTAYDEYLNMRLQKAITS